MNLELPVQEGAFAPIAQMIRLTGGITLAQLSEISELEPTTIQNWVKRGWVEPPKGRRYAEQSTARVMIISKLRGALQLSEIIELLSYVNGRVDDRSDDAIPDGRLYSMLCDIRERVHKSTIYSLDMVEAAIVDELKDYKEPFEGGYEKLKSALRVMMLASISSELKAQAEQRFSQMLRND